MIRTTLCAALVAVFPHTGFAQSQHVAQTLVRACFAETSTDAVYPDSLGQAANKCQDQLGGSTTIGIAQCVGAETDVWDAILNEEYGRTRHLFLKNGGEDLTRSLRDAQPAWIAFRDADCALQYERWAAGSCRSIAHASCLLKMTASRAVVLREMAEENQ
jgi:uncharacterized protein YecT (DUF1311 family)